MYDDARKEFVTKLNEILSSQQKPTILVAGFVGCGKTTLVKNVLGNGIVGDDAIGHGKSTTKGFVPYSDDFITLIDSQGFEPPMPEKFFLDFVNTQIEAKQYEDDISKHIHLSWYCIEGSKARVTPTDINLINRILPQESTLVIVTKMDITKPVQKDAITQELLANTSVTSERILYVSEKDKESWKALVEKSKQILPEAYKSAFMSKQKVVLKDKKVLARKAIREFSSGAGLIGILPVVDIPFIIAIQYKLVARLAKIYGFNGDEAQKLLAPSALVTAAGSAVGGGLLDLAGPIGWIAGGFSAGAVTGGLGTLVSNYFLKCSEAIFQGKEIDSLPVFELEKEGLRKAADEFMRSFNKEGS